MTERNAKNREIYLDICEKVFDFSPEAMEYIKHRTSDEWEPVPELKKLLEIEGATYEDQRLRMNIDMSNPELLSLFKNDDRAFSLFKSLFGRALSTLSSEYSCVIGYPEFIKNKATFRKNETKIKKIFETVYAENPELFARETENSYSKEACSDFIVKAFERIGASKKSAKNLQLVISFNPFDWLLSSTSEEFSSCFNINNPSGGYQYCLGLPFLCGDRNRMMIYIAKGCEKSCMGITVDSVQSRTWCILDKSDNYCIVKWYPNDTISPSIVRTTTKNSHFVSSSEFSRGKYPIDVISTKKGAYIGVYSDMGRLVAEDDKLWLKGNDKTGQQLFPKQLVDITKNDRNSFHLTSDCQHIRYLMPQKGFIIPKWRERGFHLDAMFPTLICKGCGQDKAGMVLRKNEAFYCFDCVKDNIKYCDNCHSEYWVKDGEHEVLGTDGKKIHLCPECFKSKDSMTCGLCGGYSYNETLFSTRDGKKICCTCLNKHAGNYAECDQCGTISNDIMSRYDPYLKTLGHSCHSCNTDQLGYQTTFGKYFGFRSIQSKGGYLY